MRNATVASFDTCFLHSTIPGLCLALSAFFQANAAYANDVFWVNFDKQNFTINETMTGNLFGYFNDTDTSDFVTFDTVSNFGINAMTGGDRVVMSFPAFASNQGLTFNPNVPGNGDGIYVNQYTMMWDIYITSRDNWFSFYQTNENNTNDGEFFIRPTDGGIGISGVYNGEIELNRWIRVGITVDLTQPAARMRKFIDGNLVGTVDLSGVDGRWSMYHVGVGETNLLLTDNDGDTLDGFISAFYFSDRVLSDAEMQAWGGVDAAGFDTVAQPGVKGSYIYYSGSAFDGGDLSLALDSSKVLAKETGLPQTLGFENLINSSLGINGIVFDINGLNSTELTTDDFVFQVSPTGAFNQLDHPPANWQSASDPISINVVSGSPDRVILVWSDNSVANRWLRVTVKATPNTGLASDERYYIGHLLGETNGDVVADVFTVSFSDITLIRTDVGQTVDASNTQDIDKSGTVSFGDISAMRSNVGTQLTNITLP